MASARCFLAILLLAGAATAFAGPVWADSPDSLAMLRPGQVIYPDGAEGVILPDTLPFGEGEVMDFDILYGFVKVGRARLETLALTDRDGTPTLEIKSRAKSARWVDTIYKVRDQVTSLLDLDRLHSLRFSKHLREGNYSFDLETEFLHDAGIARYDDGTEKEFEAGSQDILTALFYVRTFPLEVGMILHIPVHDGKKGYPLRVEVMGREVVETPLGEIPCLVLEPRLESEGLFNSEGRMLVYLSDDEKRLPVMLKAKAPVGAFSSQLRSYRGGLPLRGIAWMGD